MKHKPETWARAEQLIFMGERADAFEAKLNQELKETFSANDPRGRAGWGQDVEREIAYLLPRSLKTV